MGEKKKNNMTVLLGAAFLMATSAIGPGFLTQTATFTGQYGSIFAMVIICTILLDVTTQLNIWSIIGVSGMRGQDIANKVLPGLGYFIAVSWLPSAAWYLILETWRSRHGTERNVRTSGQGRHDYRRSHRHPDFPVQGCQIR